MIGIPEKERYLQRRRYINRLAIPVHREFCTEKQTQFLSPSIKHLLYSHKTKLPHTIHLYNCSRLESYITTSILKIPFKMQFPSILSAALLALSVQHVAGFAVPAPPAPAPAPAPAPTTPASTDCPAQIAACLKPNGDSSFNAVGCSATYQQKFETCAHSSLW